MKNKLAPIVIFVYNRPWHTEQTIKALQRNELAKESDIFIYSDAPKNEKSEKKVNEVRNYIRTVSGFKSVTIMEREKNMGLANSIIDGVTNIVNKYGNIIVLEDDLVTSPSFLRFMNKALELYKNEEQVASIHGYMYPIEDLPKTFFIKGADCWGWATWDRAWKNFEKDGKKLFEELKKKRAVRDFDFNNSYDYTRMLKQQIQGKNNSWAIRWYASAFLKNMLTLHPGKSYVENIGNDNSGTHCRDSNAFESGVLNKEIDIIKIDLVENLSAKRKIEFFFKSLKPFSLSSIKNRLLRVVK